MRALILVDLQNDFIPDGALAVPDGDAVVAIANEAMQKFDSVVATQDWHPADHGSFASQYKNKTPGESVLLNRIEQILWPDHTVQGTKGAEFVDGLNMERVTKVIKKGMDKGVDSYSGFFDNDHKRATGLERYLKAQSVDEVFIMGLATDYCVKFTTLDACLLGFKTNVIKEGVRGVELEEGDVEKAFEEMKMAGAKIISINDL